MTELARQRCEACTGDTPRLTAAEVAQLSAQLDRAWSVEDGVRLSRHLTFTDFRSAFDRAAAIAEVAEREGHHPDLCVGWGHLDIDITTHAIHALSRNDFILAAKIDQLG